MKLTAIFNPPVPPEMTLPATLSFQGVPLTVVEFSLNEYLVLESERSVDVGDFQQALSSWTGVNVEIFVEKAKPVLTLVANNVKPIWDTLFRKPPPVSSQLIWGESPESDKVIYVPNDLSKGEGFCEDALTNAYYTQVLVKAYTKFCEVVDIDPWVKLWDGVTVLRCRGLGPLDGCQQLVENETVSRLANSTLVGFDDRPYQSQFLEVLKGMEGEEYESEAVYVTVMMKAEYALLGVSDHTSNQKISLRIFRKLQEGFENPDSAFYLDSTLMSAVVGLVRKMVIEGFVLERSVDEFRSRATRAFLGEHVEEMMEVYEAGLRGGF